MNKKGIIVVLAAIIFLVCLGTEVATTSEEKRFACYINKYVFSLADEWNKVDVPSEKVHTYISNDMCLTVEYINGKSDGEKLGEEIALEYTKNDIEYEAIQYCIEGEGGFVTFLLEAMADSKQNLRKEFKNIKDSIYELLPFETDYLSVKQKFVDEGYNVDEIIEIEDGRSYIKVSNEEIEFYIYFNNENRIVRMFLDSDAEEATRWYLGDIVEGLDIYYQPYSMMEAIMTTVKDRAVGLEGKLVEIEKGVQYSLIVTEKEPLKIQIDVRRDFETAKEYEETVISK